MTFEDKSLDELFRLYLIAQLLGTGTGTSVQVTNFPASTEIANDVGNPVPVNGTVTVGNFPASTEISNDAGNPIPVGLDAASLAALETTELGAATLAALESVDLNAATLAALELIGVKGVDGTTAATLGNPFPVGAPQEFDAGNSTTITNTGATFTGAWKRTRTLGLVEQQTVIASSVTSGLGATVTFQYSEDGATPTVSEVRPIASFSSVRNLQLENFGEFYRIIVTPSRALTVAEFIYVTTQHNRLPGGQFVRLADQTTERAFASMARTFAYLKGFDPATGLDANVAVNAAGTIATEEILSFPTLSLAGKGYSIATLVNIALSAETDFVLIRNTGSKVVRIWEQLVAMPDSATTVRSIIRTYKNPTITSNGTSLAVNGLRNGQPASLVLASTSPVISARGTLMQVFGAVNAPVIRQLDLTRYIEPGDSLLVTAQPSGATTNHSFVMSWAEI